MGNEEGRIGCSQVCVPFKGSIGGAVRVLFFPLHLSSVKNLQCSCFDSLFVVLPLPQKGPQEELVLVDLDLSILEVRSVLRSVPRSSSDSSPAAHRTLARCTGCGET